MFQNLANAIINADELQEQTKGRYKRPKSAPTKCKTSEDQALYDRILGQVNMARVDRFYNGQDPTHGALNFNLRGTGSIGNLFNAPEHPISTQNGPFNNSFTQGGLPATGVFVNTYYNTLWRTIQKPL